MPETTISPDEAGQKLHRYLARLLPGLTRGQLHKLIRTRKVRVNGRKAEAHTVLNAGDRVLIHMSPEGLARARKAASRRADSIDFEIRYEDDCLLVVSKPAGLPVHPGAGHRKNSLIDQVHAYLEVDENAEFRPALVHRLDRDTSGLVVIGKTYRAVRRLGEAFKAGRVRKSYLALCLGTPRPRRGTWQLEVRRLDVKTKSEREAGLGITEYKVALERKLHLGSESLEVALLVLRLKTGRTHQIRSHLLQAGHPLVGDPRYGNRELNRLVAGRFGLRRQFLHAYRLRFEHPVTGNPLRLADPYPDDLQPMVSALRLGVPAD